MLPPQALPLRVPQRRAQLWLARWPEPPPPGQQQVQVPEQPQQVLPWLVPPQVPPQEWLPVLLSWPVQPSFPPVAVVVVPLSETPLSFTFSSVASPIPLTFLRSSMDLNGPLALR